MRNIIKDILGSRFQWSGSFAAGARAQALTYILFPPTSRRWAGHQPRRRDAIAIGLPFPGTGTIRRDRPATGLGLRSQP